MSAAAPVDLVNVQAVDLKQYDRLYARLPAGALYTGPVLTIVSIAAAVVGVIALVWGCIKDGKTESK